LTAPSGPFTGLSPKAHLCKTASSSSKRNWAYWKEAILHDLERVHSDIRPCVSRIDIMRMGHAMIRPAVGAIFSEERRRLRHLNGRILFANSDLSGISIFEERQYHGVEAAQKVLRRLHG